MAHPAEPALHISSDGTIKDYCDGTKFKNHPLFSQDPYALQIVAHYNELELVKSNKVGVVSNRLGNVHPIEYRSKMKMAQLAVVATIPVIEVHMLHSVIKPFIHDTNVQATEGIVVSIEGSSLSFLSR